MHEYANECVDAVQNLGSWFHSHMSTNKLIEKMYGKPSRCQYKIRQIRKSLSKETKKFWYMSSFDFTFGFLLFIALRASAISMWSITKSSQWFV